MPKLIPRVVSGKEKEVFTAIIGLKLAVRGQRSLKLDLVYQIPSTEEILFILINAALVATKNTKLNASQTLLVFLVFCFHCSGVKC